MKLILKSVLLNEKIQDVLIVDSLYAKIGENLLAEDFENAEVVNCAGLALVPPFYNGHCHAAMTLLRGYADDMPLKEWLENHIWPFEAKLDAKAIEVGSRLAILEMIKSGTVFFSDMYWHREATIKVAEEMGVRGAIGVTIAENLDTPEHIEENFKFLKEHRFESERIKLAVMPHSIYTVGENVFRRCVEVAKAENYVLHTHLSETLSEVNEAKEKFNMTPVEAMDKWGVLGENFVAAHCVHLSENDMSLMADSCSTAILNVCSNLQLSSGIPKICKMHNKGMLLGIGTDGASSNNNLDMHEDMKFASLLAKVEGGASAIPAKEILKMATENVARAYGVRAGVIQSGFLADGLLLDLKNERLNPNHNLISNWVYAADASAIHSVICNGKFIMKNRHVDGEIEIVKEAESMAKSLC